MREKETEQKLVREVKKLGGICPKFTSPGTDGMPDRIILLPEGKMAFAELKAPGKKPRVMQLKRIKQLKDLGFKCFVIDRPEQIEEILKITGGE